MTSVYQILTGLLLKAISIFSLFCIVVLYYDSIIFTMGNVSKMNDTIIPNDNTNANRNFSTVQCDIFVNIWNQLYT